MGERTAPYVSPNVEALALKYLDEGHVDLDYYDGREIFSATVTSSDGVKTYTVMHTPGKCWHHSGCKNPRKCWHVPACRRFVTIKGCEICGPPPEPNTYHPRDGEGES